MCDSLLEYESICWQNGIASHYSLFPLENAQFTKGDIPKCLDFELFVF